MKTTYIIRDRETGTTIEECVTYEEALKIVERYEDSDKTEGIYEPDFYEIVEEEE